jgi:hypothetical protein
MAFDRIVEHRPELGCLDGGWVEQHETGGSDPGARQARCDHCAPAMADHGQVVSIEVRLPNEPRDVGRGLHEPMATAPVARSAVAGQVDGRDPETGRSQSRPDTPPGATR